MAWGSDNPILFVTLFAVAALVLAVVLPAANVLHRRRVKRLSHEASDAAIAQTKRVCSCGYSTEHLDRIRCPECGRVFGFDATPEELGLDDAELRRASEARDKRKLAAPPSDQA